MTITGLIQKCSVYENHWLQKIDLYVFFDRCMLGQKLLFLCVAFSAGLLLVCYVVFNQYFNGKVFLSLNFALDTIFEIVYCLFPLLYLSGDGLFSLSSLGILGQQNGFIFVQSLFAMIFLARKCIFLMRDLNPTYIAKSYWVRVTRKFTIEHDSTPWIIYKAHDSKPGYYNQTYRIGNSNLYRLIVEPFDTKSAMSATRARNTTIEVQATTMDERDERDERDEQLPAETISTINPYHQSHPCRVQTNTNGLAVDGHISQLASASASASPSVSTTPKSENDGVSKYDFRDPAEPHDSKSPSMNQSPERDELSQKNNLSCCSHNYDDKLIDIFTQQRKRKCVIGGCGCAFITIGILIALLFIGFIENDYKNKCFYDINSNLNNSNSNNSNSNEWFKLHKELKYFDVHCQYQVVNMFNNYPCNCRYYARYSTRNESDKVTDEFSPEMVELVFLHYDDLQNIYLQGDSPEISDIEFHFTKEMLNSMKYLQIWIMDGIGINNIWSSQGMKKLQNLEIFSWRGIGGYMGLNTTIPFKSFSKLEKLKAMVLTDCYHVLNQEIPDDMCNLKEIKYLEIEYLRFVEYIPYDCIATNWKELRYLVVAGILQTTYMPPQIWNLPNLETVLIAGNAFSIAEKSFDFDTFDGFSESLRSVWLPNGVEICTNGTIVIDNVEYKGFNYLGYGRNSTLISDDDNTELLKFIAKFDPCRSPCAIVSFDCYAIEWQNGVCLDECNIEECNYDGGDCNQLCDCEYDLWFNNQCDDECNTTQCNWDFYQCVESVDANETCNVTGGDMVNYTIPCYVSWTDDTWCDTVCNVESCDYDGGMCDRCDEGTTCNTILHVLQQASSGDDDYKYGYDVLIPEVVCPFKNMLVSIMDEFDTSDNCSVVFDFIDLNHNGFIGWHELVQTFAYRLKTTTPTHWNEKVEQIDCSACVNNVSYYYW